MRNITAFTTNATQQIAEIRKTRREESFYVNTIYAYGTYGGGTLAFYVSPDRGTTLIPLTSSPGGTGISLTANGMIGGQFGHPSTNLQTSTLYATLSGATNPNIMIVVDDNNQ